MPIVLVFESDIGKNIGVLLSRELKVDTEIISIDQVHLHDFDYIDIGEVMEKVEVVPIVVMPAEGIALNRVSTDMEISESWEASLARAAIARPWVLVVLATDEQGETRLASVRLLRFQAKDFRDGKRVWNRARQLHAQGETAYEDLRLDGPESRGIFYVNTKNTTGTRAAGTATTPRSFWLSKHRMADLMWSSTSE